MKKIMLLSSIFLNSLLLLALFFSRTTSKPQETFTLNTDGQILSTVEYSDAPENVVDYIIYYDNMTDSASAKEKVYLIDNKTNHNYGVLYR